MRLHAWAMLAQSRGLSERLVPFDVRRMNGMSIRKYCSRLFVPGIALFVACGSSEENERLPTDGGRGSSGGVRSTPTGGISTQAGGASGEASSGDEFESGADGGGTDTGGADAGGPSEAGSGSSEAGAPGMEDDTSSTIRGTVVDYEFQLPLAGQTVVVAGEVTQTGADGTFSLPRPSRAYDLEIIDADGVAISIYQGITRSAPRLVHFPATPMATPARSEIVQGTLSGDLTFPLRQDRPSDIVSIYLLSERGNVRSLVGGGLPPYGPDYTAYLAWDGPETLDATLFAFASAGSAETDSQARYRAFAASVPVVLEDGGALTQDVELAELPIGVLSGSAQLPAGVQLSNYETFYRFPLPRTLVAFPNADLVGGHPPPTAESFTFDLPKLDVSGARLCVAVRSDVDGTLRSERCGVELDGDPVQLELQASPILSAPEVGAPFDQATRFEWSAFDGGVSILELMPSAVTPKSPSIHVFTAATAFDAQTLPEDSVDFARAAYDVVVVGVGPFEDLDAAVGVEGLATSLRNESRFAKGLPRALGTAP